MKEARSLMFQVDHRKSFTHLFEIVQVLPMATAVCECGFSTLKRGKNDWRSRLSTNTLKKLAKSSISLGALERWRVRGEPGGYLNELEK